MVKVSVIVPVYNVEKYLSKCLDSILNQTLKDIEIICINDGSSDMSPEILKTYAQKDARIIVLNQVNKGLGAARNAGIQIAKGEYIGFVDSDDFIDEDFYEKLYLAAVKNNAEIAAAGYERINYKGIKYTDERVYTTPEEKYKLTNIPKACYVWNKIYKNSDLRMSEIKFREGVFYEDLLFSHQALYFLPKLVTVPGTYYHQFDNPYSIMHQKDVIKEKDFKQAVKDSVDFIIRHNVKINLSDYPPLHTERIKLLGLKFIKVKKWEHIQKYYLFNCIELMEKIIT